MPGDESVLKKSRGTEDQEQVPCLPAAPEITCAVWSKSLKGQLFPPSPLQELQVPSAQRGKAGDPTQ